MRYEMMLPFQIRRAIDEDWPVVMPIGVLEYHGEHLAVGTDTLVVIRAIELLEKEIDMVILPPFYYGAASYAVEPAERNGTVNVGCEQLIPFADGLFASLLKIGGHLAFDKEELDRVVANGDMVRRRGHPRKS